MKKFLFVFFYLLINLPVFAFRGDENLIVKLYTKINPAIVCINAQSSCGMSCGTGCIIDTSGVILTSAHVIDDCKNIIITTFDGKSYEAKILKQFGEKQDIILLKINSKEKLHIVKMGNSEKIKVGQKVLAIGNPFGFSGTLTEGIISRIDYAKNRIQTDAVINPGSSGGPLLNCKGEIIGINQSIFNPDNNISNIGIGFAIPINIVKEYLNETNLI